MTLDSSCSTDLPRILRPENLHHPVPGATVVVKVVGKVVDLLDMVPDVFQRVDGRGVVDLHEVGAEVAVVQAGEGEGDQAPYTSADQAFD